MEVLWKEVWSDIGGKGAEWWRWGYWSAAAKFVVLLSAKKNELQHRRSIKMWFFWPNVRMGREGRVVWDCRIECICVIETIKVKTKKPRNQKKGEGTQVSSSGFCYNIMPNLSTLWHYSVYAITYIEVTRVEIQNNKEKSAPHCPPQICSLPFLLLCVPKQSTADLIWDVWSEIIPG